MAKVHKISGFPEWLPEQKLVEDQVIATIKRIYESHGFTPLETPAVELLSTLLAKGVADKEIYVLKRLADDGAKEGELGLHFDLTVPFARYTAQHMNSLVFPLKRYQLQKVWRGERPQKGRFREFYQFDIDTVMREKLPLSCDAEMLTVIAKVFRSLNIGRFEIAINNRKILLGLYESLGLKGDDRKQAIIAVDKLAKIGREGVLVELTDKLGIQKDTAEQIVEWCEIEASSKDFEGVFSKLEVENDLFREGVGELQETLSLLEDEAKEHIVIQVRLARGLDYYTGIIIETTLSAYPQFGALCSGGRYDDLVSQFTKEKLPGVGVSIGLSRLMELIFEHELLPLQSLTPTKILVAVYGEDQRRECNRLAEEFRTAGIPTEVHPASPKLGKQIDYASKKKIQWVAFINPETKEREIKNILSGEQRKLESVESFSKLVKGPHAGNPLD